jgi:phosphopantothenoylcysteine decarboxylase / phosphopantothenate---cysteine ligase
VSPATRNMGGDDNSIHLITPEGVESWPPQSKDGVAQKLIGRMAATLGPRRP